MDRLSMDGGFNSSLDETTITPEGRDIKNSYINQVADLEDLNCTLSKADITKSVDDFQIHGVKLSWQGLNVHVDLPKPSFFKRILNRAEYGGLKKKQILFDVKGSVKPGCLLAVMGSSGAGKTTLMNILAHQNIQGMDVQGTVKVNGKIIGRRIKSCSAYVQQEDLFMGLLTVREHLIFQAMLRIDQSVPKSEKMKKVETVIQELGLVKCQNTLIGIPGRIRGISGGQLKRLSFASELLMNPSLLFVDEPTSGLDSFMALNVVSALENLARSGRTILATIHQPSSEVFRKFDRLLLMSEGRVAYMGPTSECNQFFEECGYQIPRNYNPSDFYIKVLAIIPGYEEICKEKALNICEKFESKTRGERKRSPSDVSFVEQREISRPKYNASTVQQFKMLLWRGFLKSWRNPTMNYVKFITRVTLGFIIGLIYLQQKEDQQSVHNISGLLFFTVMSSIMSSYGPSLLSLSGDLPIFFKEHKIAMYRVDVFLISNLLTEMPVNVLAQVAQTTIVYWMAGLRNDVGVFFMFVGICVLSGQAGVGFAYLISALLMDPKVISAVGNLFVLPQVIFGGLLVNLKSIPVFLDWLKYLSIVKYGYEALSIIQWKGVTSIACPRNTTVPCIFKGSDVIKSIGLSEEDLVLDICMLVVLLIGYRLIAFAIIFARSWRR